MKQYLKKQKPMPQSTNFFILKILRDRECGPWPFSHSAQCHKQIDISLKFGPLV